MYFVYVLYQGLYVLVIETVKPARDWNVVFDVFEVHVLAEVFTLPAFVARFTCEFKESLSVVLPVSGDVSESLKCFDVVFHIDVL